MFTCKPMIIIYLNKTRNRDWDYTSFEFDITFLWQWFNLSNALDGRPIVVACCHFVFLFFFFYILDMNFDKAENDRN